MENATDLLDGKIAQPNLQLKNYELKKGKSFGLLAFLRLAIVLVFVIQVKTVEGVRHCRDDQHEVHKDNQFVSCRDCPSCAKGFGLTPPCGDIINFDTVVECKECLLGATYSRYHGTGSCHPCTVCSPDQVIKTECTLTSNRECDVKCKSKHKYYASKVKHDCQNCSWCCGTSSDDRQQECIDKGMPKNKQCSIDQADRCRPSTTPPQKTQSITATMTQTKPTSLPTEASSSSDMDGGLGKASVHTSNDISQSLELGLSFAAFALTVGLIVGLIWWKRCRNFSISDEKARKAEEGQSMEMVSTDVHVDDDDEGFQRETQSTNKRCLTELRIVGDYHRICLLLACKPFNDCGDYTDVARHYCMQYECICALKEGTEGPTQNLFSYLEAHQPNLTVEEFAAALTTKKINRPDVVEILKKYYYCN